MYTRVRGNIVPIRSDRRDSARDCEFIMTRGWSEREKLLGRALKMEGSASEYRGNFREAEAVIILIDASIRHLLNYLQPPTFPSSQHANLTDVPTGRSCKLGLCYTAFVLFLLSLKDSLAANFCRRKRDESVSSARSLDNAAKFSLPRDGGWA